METTQEQKVINLQPLEKDQVDGKPREILEATEKAMGAIPNMYKNFANSPALFQAYTAAYDAFRKETNLTPAEQETVLLTSSVANDCHYCKAAHTFLSKNMSQVPKEVYTAILEGREIPDEKFNALSRLTRKFVEKKGWLSQEDIEEFKAAGYTEKHVLDVLAGVGTKVFSNYLNHLFQTPVDDMFNS